MTATTLRQDVPPIAQAQAEVYWLAFQSLPLEAQLILRERVLGSESYSPELGAELASWQAAASEALFDFEGLLDDQTQ